MVDLSCKRCGSASFVKSGFVRGHRRYRCRDCGCNFTDARQACRNEGLNRVGGAVLLYAMGNASYGMDHAGRGGDRAA